MELAQLFQDLETLVVQQDAAVTDIEQTGIVINDNVAKGEDHLDVAVKKAKAARRKKWICFGICGRFQLIELLVAFANLDSRHCRRHHHHCPRRPGRQRYAFRASLRKGMIY